MQICARPPGSEEAVALAVADDGTWQAAQGLPELGRSWWALPGLCDAHAHLAADRLQVVPGDPDQIRARARACLERGTFLVLDKGWNDHSVIATLSGTPPSEAPDLEAAGRIIAVPGGYYEGFAVETDSDGLPAVVEGAVRSGQGWVKIIGDWPRKGKGALPNFDQDQLETVVDIAHRGGARVAIHTMAPEVPSMAVAAGVDSIEHGLFLSAGDLETLADRGGAWVPTVLRSQAMLELLGPESSGGRLMQRGLANLRELLEVAPESLTVLAGTDLATGPGEVGKEVAALVELGLSSRRAVDAASAAARRYCGRPEGFRLGEPADAVFFDVDPYLQPEVLTAPAAVVRSGTRIR